MDKLEVVAWRWTYRDRVFGGRSTASTVKPVEHERVIDLQPLTPLAPAQEEIERLTRERDEWERAAGFAVDKANEYASHAEAERRRALAAEAQVERMRGALRSAQSFIADGGLAQEYPGSAIYAEVTDALQREPRS